jgi:hypothetical protein
VARRGRGKGTTLLVVHDGDGSARSILGSCGDAGGWWRRTSTGAAWQQKDGLVAVVVATHSVTSR